MVHFGSTSANLKNLAGEALSLQDPSAQNPQREFSSSQKSFELLFTFFPEFNPEDRKTLPQVLKPLAKGLGQGKDLLQAYRALSKNEQNRLEEKIGRQELKEIFSLSLETDEVLFWNQSLHLAQRLVAEDRLNPAVGILGRLAQDKGEVPSEIQQKAEKEFNAVIGKGSAIHRLEFLTSRLVKDATDYKMIIPMFAGSMVYQIFRAGALSRLALVKNARWFNQGFAPRFISGAVGFTAEVPTFSLTSQGLRQLAGEPVGPMGQELFGAGITLGFLKGFGFLGHGGFNRLHGINEMGTLTRLEGLAKISRPLIPQAAMFTGLLMANGLETKIGLRPQMDGETMITDTLSSLFALGIGSHLGHRALNTNFTGFEAYHKHLARQARIDQRGLKLSKSWKLPNGQSPFRPALVAVGISPPGKEPIMSGLKSLGTSYMVGENGNGEGKPDISAKERMKRILAIKDRHKGLIAREGKPVTKRRKQSKTAKVKKVKARIKTSPSTVKENKTKKKETTKVSDKKLAQAQKTHKEGPPQKYSNDELADALERNQENRAATAKELRIGESTLRLRIRNAPLDSRLAAHKGVTRAGGKGKWYSDQNLVQALMRNEENIKSAAEKLGIKEKTLRRRIKRAPLISPLAAYKNLLRTSKNLLRTREKHKKVSDEALLRALESNEGKIKATARELGVDPKTVRDRIKTAPSDARWDRFKRRMTHDE